MKNRKEKNQVESCVSEEKGRSAYPPGFVSDPRPRVWHVSQEFPKAPYGCGVKHRFPSLLNLCSGKWPHPVTLGRNLLLVPQTSIQGDKKEVLGTLSPWSWVGDCPCSSAPRRPCSPAGRCWGCSASASFPSAVSGHAGAGQGRGHHPLQTQRQ